MSRKPKKGYFVKGKFVAEGSELDLQLKAELKGTTESTKTDLKREMDALQDLGKDLLTLRADLFKRLQLPDQLVDALAEAKRITNFEGKRRQMQFVGKLMRKLHDEQVEAIRQAMDEQRTGSAGEKMALHVAEQWRDRLVAEESALSIWLDHFPGTDVQQLRSLIRQARKDLDKARAEAAAAAEAAGPDAAPRETGKGRAYRELFQLVREQLASTDKAGKADSDAAADDEEADDA
ncbi:ribosome biogenesis factor YjgA [Comamonas terrae]|uniref:Dual-action ribosomal maturation protein DarP n=1 Tax=Comamonas terrae TaxID=673548 RepID=A0ABW5URK3_9BURK|nr:ribosome biogenesis factor YjgA [Comamonas terrae]